MINVFVSFARFFKFDILFQTKVENLIHISIFIRLFSTQYDPNKTRILVKLIKHSKQAILSNSLKYTPTKYISNGLGMDWMV